VLRPAIHNAGGGRRQSSRGAASGSSPRSAGSIMTGAIAALYFGHILLHFNHTAIASLSQKIAYLSRSTNTPRTITRSLSTVS
jgi:hypothetical protein